MIRTPLCDLLNIGTRFLASQEALVAQEWKRMIIDAASEEAVKFMAWNEFIPKRSGGYETSMRAIRTPFIDHWQQHPDRVAGEADSLRDKVLEAMRQRNLYKLVPGAGQSVGLVDDILPAAEIVQKIAVEAAQALKKVHRALCQMNTSSVLK